MTERSHAGRGPTGSRKGSDVFSLIPCKGLGRRVLKKEADETGIIKSYESEPAKRRARVFAAHP